MLRKYTWRTGLLESGLIALGLLFLFPIVGMLNVAFKPANSLSSALAFDWPPTFDNFVQAWQQADLGGALLRTLFITLISTTVVVVIATMAAYPLARIGRRWSNAVFYSFIAGLMIPGQLGLLPLYTTFRDLSMIGSVWSVILIEIGGNLPLSIFLATGFLRSLPVDFEEAAMLDGCGPVACFWRVVFPLIKPVAGTIFILVSVGVWNDFFTPLLYLTGTPNQTITVSIYSFVGQYVSHWPLVFAGLIISIIPVLVIYLLFQRHIINGFAGGLKG